MRVEPSFPKIPQLKTVEDFARRLDELGITLPLDADIEAGPQAPLAQPLTLTDGSAGARIVGNRFTILPMEGWDCTLDGRPSDLVMRRWRRFGASGAKLVWCEATAVRHDGRANPNQLLITRETVAELAELRAALVAAHAAAFDCTDDLAVGLQLTHSGRWSRPDGTPSPRIAYRHPLLDTRAGILDDAAVFSDDELDDLAACYVDAAVLAHEAGFHFVDIKHCHGYLLHELLSAYDRPGRYGGDLAGRTLFLRTVVEGARARAPDLALAVRLSAYDFVPFTKGDDATGVPVATAGYPYAFGGDATGTGIDLGEPHAFLSLLERLGIGLVSISAGSPYYNPHIQRPAYYPPSDGYLPPEDPLVGVARMLHATAELKQRHPNLAMVGTGYSYLQEWLPHVAQRAVRDGLVDSIGLGRMALSYPNLPADILAGKPLDHRHICRTFSDCTTAPRGGLVSGCYPLDAFYKDRPEHERLAAQKRAARRKTS